MLQIAEAVIKLANSSCGTESRISVQWTSLDGSFRRFDTDRNAAAGWLFGFPLILLSMLELGTTLAIVSPRIYASLLRSPGPWLLFYLETALLVVGCMGATYGLLQLSPRLILAGGPILMAMAFAYFRLLGRLAWWLSEREGRRLVDEHVGDNSTI